MRRRGSRATGSPGALRAVVFRSVAVGVVAFGVAALLVFRNAALGGEILSDPAPRPAKYVASDTVAIGLPEVLDPVGGVRDPVFALLAGLVSTGSYGTLTGERLERELLRLKAKSRLPHQTVAEVTRLPVQPGYTSYLTVSFREPLDLAVPYSILGYHPGSFTASELCHFREWEFPRLRLEESSGTESKVQTRSIELTDVHIFALEIGEIWIDIDAVVDKLLGGALDDTRVTVLVLCRHEGEWLGVATGYGRDHRGRSGVLSLREDKILFPTPGQFKGIGRQLRGKAEALMKIWDGAGGSTKQATAPAR